MPVYTLIITDAQGTQYETRSDFPDDGTAIADTGVFVSADHPSVALARDVGEVEFLGLWDFNDGSPTWTAED